MSADQSTLSPDDWEPDGPARALYENKILLPGFGEQPDRCRQRKPVGFCEHGHVHLASASPCGTRRCPEHSGLWRKDAAVKIVARLAAWRHVQEGAGKRLLHVVDSPDPKRWWTAEAFWDERSDSYDVLREVGGRGGVCIPHPYRTSDEGEWLFRTACDAGDWDEKKGKWSLLRRAADDWEEMSRFIEPGPHFHHLVAAEDFDPEAVPDRRTVKNIRSLERFHIRDMTGYRDMARLAMYTLSHAAHQPKALVEDGHSPHTVTYWGDVHPNGFNPEEELTAAEWGRIQLNAKRAVTTTPTDVLEEAGATETDDRAECPRDGCVAPIVPIDELAAWLNDTEWVMGLSRKQRRILNGALRWLDNMGDRPPPTSDPARLREWLRQEGRKVERREQGRIGAFG